MTRFVTRVAAAVVPAMLFAAPLKAQWPDYPTPGTPRTSSGEPDLAAPAPRTAEGRVDFTGIWERAVTPSEAVQSGEAPPVATFFDIGSNIEGGPPFTPWARELRAERMAAGMAGNPDAHCLPMGHMQFHLHPQPRKIVQTRDVIVILYEGNAGIRQIFLDGRALPDPEGLWPWWYGYSVGRWDGDTLVVETIGFRDDVWLDVNGSPLTSGGRIIERFRRPGFGRMEIDVTIEDPRSYTEPFTVRVEHQILLDSELIEFVCIENEQSSRYYD
jgi:hypothetical protein